MGTIAVNRPKTPPPPPHHTTIPISQMVRSALRHGCCEWANHDAWFRARMMDEFAGLDAGDAEKMSRFILSLLLAAPGEIDYARERQLFKYNKLSPNSRTHEHTNLDYVDGKRPLRVAIEELSVLTDDADCSATLIHELVQLIECGRRKRKVSETQSVGSSRSSSSSSSYEEEFPSLGQRRAAEEAAAVTTTTTTLAPKSAPPWQPHENSHWSSAPQLIPIEKAPYQSTKSPKPLKTHQNQRNEQTGQNVNSSKYRFAFKNPKNKKTTTMPSKTPSPIPTPPPPRTATTTPTPPTPTPPLTKPKKTKTTKSGRPPDLVVKHGKTTIVETKTVITTTTTTTTKPDEKHCKKRERNRKRKRPRKKKTPQKTDKNSSDSISPVPSTSTTTTTTNTTTTTEPLPRAQNLDSFTSLDDALVFLQNQSGAAEGDDCDGEIWRKVMADQHVKYVNGSFFFSPRIKMPIRKPKPRNEADPLLAHAARIAYRTVSTIFDAMDDTSVDETNSDQSRMTAAAKMQLSISDDKWPVKKPTSGMPVWTTGPTW